MGKFIHSFWTVPMLLKLNIKSAIELLVYCYATSVAWAKRCGATIELYGDGFACDLLSFLPYDSIHLIKIPENIPTCTWAASKFFVLKEIELGDVHIDGDVFIKSEKLVSLILDTKYDLVILQIENAPSVMDYYDITRNIFKNNSILSDICDIDYRKAYNCGVVGFNNKQLKEIYLTEYFLMVEKISKSSKAISEFEQRVYIIPDLIIELQFLHLLAKNYRVNNILGDSYTYAKKAIELNYLHVLGPQKEYELPLIKKELEFVNKDIYLHTNSFLLRFIRK